MFFYSPGADEFEWGRTLEGEEKEGTREHGERGRGHFKREKSTRTGEVVRAGRCRRTAVPPPKTAAKVPLNPNKAPQDRVYQPSTHTS